MTTPSPLKAALWYGKHGYSIFPVHNAIFDDADNCTGCTCEEWNRSEENHQRLTAQGREVQFDPNYKCPQPGKCPRVNWGEKSTTDEATIRKWWTKAWRNVDVETGQVVWNIPNIAVDMGKSGVLAFDKDLYKDTYAGDTLQIDEQTVTSRTGGGGLHLWYRQPEGKAYGNATGILPAGIDVRGAGGYCVVPPSLHKSGRLYEFVEGHSPADLNPLSLPQFLVDILEAAQTVRDAVPVNFTAGSVPKPDLTRWHLSDAILDLINHGAPKGERSEADYRVILALARALATDDEIRSVFTHFAIGAKYDERGDKYLALSIGRARAWLVDRPPDAPVAAERLAVARQWVRGSDCLNYLRGAAGRRVAELVPLLDGVLEMALSRRTSRIVVTIRDIADRCGISAATAYRRLGRVEAAGLLTTKSDHYGTLIDLAVLLDLSETRYSKCGDVSLRSTSDDDFFADHRTDDAFTSYPYSYAIKRRQVPTVLMQSLGASGLLLWDALLDGGTVKDLAGVTGLTVAAVRATLKRYDAAGLLVIWEEGHAKWYELHPNAWDLLEERREHMVTAGIGQLRAARNANDKASYAQRKLQGRMPLEPRQRAKLEIRRDKADTQAAAYYSALEGMGINPHVKVQHRPSRPRIKIDHAEEYVSLYRPLFEQWEELAPLPFAERYRVLGFAGFERDEIDKARRRAGQFDLGPRQFVGVGDSLQVIAA